MKPAKLICTPGTREGRRLRAEVDEKLLRRLSSALDDADLSADQLRSYVAAYCELRKQDVAADKNAVALARIEASPPTTGSAAQRRRLSDKERAPGPSAPYGRHADGTPHTREEFHADLRRAVRDIYGLELDTEAIARTAHPGHRPARSQAAPGSTTMARNHAPDQPPRRDPSAVPP